MDKLPFVVETTDGALEQYDRLMIKSIAKKLEDELGDYCQCIDFYKLAEKIYYGEIPLDVDEVIEILKEDITELVDGYLSSLCEGDACFENCEGV